MKCSELQIGDYVKYQGHIYIVEEISAKGWVHLIHSKTKARLNLASDYIIDLMEPIPLTPEILMVNNFEYKEGWDEQWHEAEDGFGSDFQLSVDGDYLTMKDIGNARIEYVHQLQHALRLCGLSELADNLKVE